MLSNSCCFFPPIFLLPPIAFVSKQASLGFPLFVSSGSYDMAFTLDISTRSPGYTASVYLHRVELIVVI